MTYGGKDDFLCSFLSFFLCSSDDLTYLTVFGVLSFRPSTVYQVFMSHKVAVLLFPFVSFINVDCLFLPVLSSPLTFRLPLFFYYCQSSLLLVLSRVTPLFFLPSAVVLKAPCSPTPFLASHSVSIHNTRKGRRGSKETRLRAL